jgi:ribonuclease HI
MAMYYQEVRKLEDKFDGLKLNHIPRCLNEAADELAKMAFGQEPVPVGVFASNQHKPLVRYEEPW